MSESKGRRTVPRTEINQARRVRAAAIVEWFQDRIAAAKAAGVGAAVGTSGGHGVTQQMRAIKGPVPVTVHDDGTTYVNPARDLKPGRRLRPELRTGAKS